MTKGDRLMIKREYIEVCSNIVEVKRVQWYYSRVT